MSTAGFSIDGIVYDIIVSWTRMIIALVISILFSLAIGITAARNKKAESVIIPVLDVFQSIPILGFFPIVILGLEAVAPGFIGLNLAVILLIFTSMSWNIAFGVYDAVRSIPQDYIDLTQISGSGTWSRITSIYIPASLGRIAYNTQTSWAVGLFYLVSCEILTLGQTHQTVVGIGAAIYAFASTSNWNGYLYAIIALIIAVVIWQFVFLREFAIYSERYKFVEEPRSTRKDPLMKFYSWVNQRSLGKLFLMTQGRGVTRFSSSLTQFRRGAKYAFALIILLFVGLEFSALMNITSEISKLPSISTILSTESNVLVALAYSFVRVWYVYFICVLIALPLGISIALSSKLYDAAAPILEVIASIPAPVLLPVLVVYLNHNSEAVAALIIFLGMFWYIIFNIMSGVGSLPAELFELKREFKISSLQTWRNIYLPATVTAFVTGSITAIGAAWNTLIVAEYFSYENNATHQQIIYTQVGHGIGKTLFIATTNGDLLTLTLAVVSMTILIIAFNLTVWRRVYHITTKRYTYNR